MGISQKITTRREFIKHSAIVASTFPFLLSCGQGSENSFSHDAIEKFKKRFSGHIILKGDKEYEDLRWSQVKNPTMDKHPLIIARCKKEEDVLRDIEFARQHHLEIAVRSGNHSSMGWGTCENGMVIDLSQMKGITVDAKNKKVIVATGATAEEILTATIPYGLAPVLGQCGTVGSGITLGGGLGWLTGKYGAACDNLISARVITGEVEILKANSIINEDLFWAIRGGGGNFGIASSFEYKLHPVKEMLKGSFFYPISNAHAIIKFFNDFMFVAPDELQADCWLTSDKCWVEFVYIGDLDAGEHLLDNFRKFRKPEQDSVKRIPFSQLYSTEDNNSTQQKFNSWKGTYIKQLSDEVIESVLDYLSQTPQPGTTFFNFSHYMHGEVCRVLPDATAFELRTQGAAHLVLVIEWKDSINTKTCLKWINEIFEHLQPYSGGRIYSNYMSLPAELTAKAVFGTNFSRLIQLKKKYDPNNIFHLNQNILP